MAIAPDGVGPVDQGAGKEEEAEMADQHLSEPCSQPGRLAFKGKFHAMRYLSIHGINPSSIRLYIFHKQARPDIRKAPERANRFRGLR
jgi:hypothetical protein